jgi:SPX domain protein involved in polyphosphate accumulation
MAELLSHLNPVETKFFETLDGELDKVESFYKDREKDAIIRAAILKEQLRELQDHRKAFHVRPILAPLCP